jgi:hypothetical protein
MVYKIDKVILVVLLIECQNTWFLLQPLPCNKNCSYCFYIEQIQYFIYVLWQNYINASISLSIDIDAQYSVLPKSFIENVISTENLTISRKTHNFQWPICRLHKALEICLSAPTYFLVNISIFKYLDEINTLTFSSLKIPTPLC